MRASRASVFLLMGCILMVAIAFLEWPQSRPSTAPDSLFVSLTEGRVRTPEGREFDADLLTLPAMRDGRPRVLVARPRGIVTKIGQMTGLDSSGVEYDEYELTNGATVGRNWERYRLVVGPR